MSKESSLKDNVIVRKFGIDLVGDIPWGTHLCQFYESKQDLIDILVPYFAEGLRNNEFCMWVTSPPLEVAEAKKALAKAIPEIDEYLREGQLEVVSYSDWYLKGGKFDCTRVLQGWVEKEKNALKNGFEGLRLTGNTFWIERSLWQSFVDYEEAVNSVIGEHKMLALCTYCLANCSGTDVLDVVRNHIGTLVKQGDKWVLVENVLHRKKAEEAMAFQVGLLANVYDALVATDENFVITYWSKMAEKLFGWTEQESVGRELKDILQTEVPQSSSQEARAKMLRDGYEGEVYYRHKNGAYVLTETRANTLRGTKGEFKGTITAFHDITERKKAEEALKESEQKYRTIIDTAAEGIAITSPEGNHIFVNNRLSQMLGYSVDELLRKSSFELMSQEGQRRQVLPMRKSLEDNQIQYREFGFCCKDGSIMWAACNASPMFNSDGKHVANIAMFSDITEHKKAEEAIIKLNMELEDRVQQRTAQLINERKRLFDILETVPIMVCLLTPDYHVAFANRSFREKFGESGGRHCYDYCFGKSEPCAFCESYKVLETGRPHRWQVKGSDGSVIDAYDFPFTDVDGTKMILEMDIDITEQKRIEKQLKDSERLAAIGATAGMVGHDIRNPLQAITGDLYLAKEGLTSCSDNEGKKEAIESITEIEKNIDYINKIVQDLQDYARPLNPKAEKIDLKLILAELLAKLSMPDNIELSVKIENNAEKISADSYYINRIMYNIVNNAVQAMPNGGKLTILPSETQRT